MPSPLRFEPIAAVVGGRTEPVDDDWESVEAIVRFDERFEPEALEGLDEFSHVELVYVFDRVDPADVDMGARHPRGNPDWPRVGIFAQRAKDRPNRLGVSVCRLLRVHGLQSRSSARLMLSHARMRHRLRSISSSGASSVARTSCSKALRSRSSYKWLPCSDTSSAA